MGQEHAVPRVSLGHSLGFVADVSRVFERYHRGQNVAFMDGQDLGLASARRLIELHGGVLKSEVR